MGRFKSNGTDTKNVCFRNPHLGLKIFHGNGKNWRNFCYSISGICGFSLIHCLHGLKSICWYATTCCKYVKLTCVLIILILWNLKFRFWCVIAILLVPEHLQMPKLTSRDCLLMGLYLSAATDHTLAWRSRAPARSRRPATALNHSKCNNARLGNAAISI